MFWVIVIGILAVAIFLGAAKAAGMQRAKKAYEDSLEALKRDPANADLRQKTLALGRTYSNLARDSKGRTIFDEVALSNDISAACAAAHKVQNTVAVQTSEGIEDRLVKLQALKSKGLIDQNEFDERRKAILAEV